MTKSLKNNFGFPPEIVRFLGKKWVVRIFKELQNNSQVRFGELKQKFGITSKVLAQVLNEMNDFGFVNKHTNKTFPPSVIYTLSNHGKNVLDTIDKLEMSSKEFRMTEDRNGGNSKYLTKFVIMLAIEKSLLKMGAPEFHKVESKLESDFNCTIEDCVSNPTPLKKVLCELFGNCYEDIYRVIDEELKNIDVDDDVLYFLQSMKE